MNFIGQLKNFDEETGELVIKLPYIDEHILAGLDEYLDGKLRTIKIDQKEVQPLEYRHLKKWFADIGEIIKHEKRRAGQAENVTNKEKLILSYEMKKRVFPVKRIRIGDTEYVLPPPSLSLSENDLTEEVMIEGIIRMEEIYSDLGVSFVHRYVRQEKD